LLTIATIRSGIIVFMKNDENTRNAAIQAAITIHICHPSTSRIHTKASFEPTPALHDPEQAHDAELHPSHLSATVTPALSRLNLGE